MFSTRQMVDAIVNNELATVQRILNDRDGRGVPYVDLNNNFNLNHFGGHSFISGTALMFVVRCPHVNTAIFQALLNARDNAGNPVIDINIPLNNGSTLTQFILLSSLGNEAKRTLIQSLIDTRGPNGQLILNLGADTESFGILFWALHTRDAQLLNILLDARNADGTNALDINRVRMGSTLLDEALAHNHSDELITLIRNAGGISANLVRGGAAIPRQNQIREPAPAPGNDGNTPAAAQRFNGDSQNTHDPSVTHTAKSSLSQLNKLYGSNLDEQSAIGEIKQLIENFDYSKLTIDRTLSLSTAQKKEYALAFQRLLENTYESVHSYTNIKVKKICALIWKAVTDNNLEVYPEEIRRTLDTSLLTAPTYLVELKKASLIEKFIEAHLAYRGRGLDHNICVGGSIHKLLESLNKAHTEVIICTGSLSVKPAANEIPKDTISRLLRMKPVKEQIKILLSWEAVEDQSEAALFRASSKNIIENDLQRMFGVLLSQEDRDAITTNIEYLSRPILHTELENLIEEINQLPNDIDNQYRQQKIARLKGLTAHTYDENERTFEEEYQSLLQEFNSVKILDDYANNLFSSNTSSAVINPAIFIDDKSRLELEKRTKSYLAAISNLPIDEKNIATKEVSKLIYLLNDPQQMPTVKITQLEQFRTNTQNMPLKKLALAFVIAAGVALTCAVIGALVGAALTSWSGPGAAIGTFIGLLKGAAFGWAHGLVIGAAVAGIGASGAYLSKSGFFNQVKIIQTRNKFTEVAKSCLTLPLSS